MTNTNTYLDDDQELVEIPVGKRKLNGIVNLPVDATGIVLFAHGSGSSRLSSRNQYVARALQQTGLATILFDLLDEQEGIDRSKVFDIGLLAERLEIAARWVQRQDDLCGLNLGYFGASTGAAAALVAAAHQGPQVKAVVSRGGRPDLAGEALARVSAPTLLIVGSKDTEVVERNRYALAQLRCQKQLTLIPGATHLFPEPGALDTVAELAIQWFQSQFATAK